MKIFNRQISRRNFLAAIGLTGLGGGAYVRLLEPTWLGVGRHEVRLGKARGRPPLKVLQLSDFHASSVVSLNFIARSIRLGLSEQPDLICLTGDFITHEFEHFEKYADILKPLSKAAPTFAIFGNHDGGAWAARHHGYQDTTRVRELLAKSGVVLLHNAAQTIRIGDWEFTLVGLGDSWADELQPEIAFSSLPAVGVPTIVLSHNPDTKKQLKSYAWNLMLCGHTHGGQLRLPFIGAPFAPVRDKRFVEGLHRWDDRWIYITRGVGNLHGVRFNCPPEISLLTLV